MVQEVPSSGILWPFLRTCHHYILVGFACLWRHLHTCSFSVEGVKEAYLSLCKVFVFLSPNWQNIMFFNSGFWAARLIEIMHQIAQRPKTCSGQGSCFCFMATLWDDCNVNHDGINKSTHPDERYCSVNSCTNHALHSPAVSTGKGIWMLVMLYL